MPDVQHLRIAGAMAHPTISRELRRNAATRSGKLQYRATVAQWKAERAAQRPKVAKLARNDKLSAYVQERLAGNHTGRARQAATGPTSALERAPAWPAHRSTMGHQLEPAADQSPIDA